MSRKRITVSAVRFAWIVVGAALLAGCPKTTRPPAPQPETLPPVPGTSVQGATVYEVNPQASKVHILVFKGGTLARFGHNHVMSVQGLHGRIWSHASLAKSGFDLAFAVADLVVDDPAARQEAGSDFPAEIPEKDREGTRKNMLRPEVLDAEQHPEITLQSVSIAGSVQHPTVTARITIRGASHDVELSPSVRVEGARFTATGEFDLQQTDFGIKPFSAALGALEVQDRLHVKFNVVAEKK
ncbi:MAG: YceI family protein [Povalibacter sp.]